MNAISPKTEILLWDLDGTLVYWENLWVVVRIARIYLGLLHRRFPLINALLGASRAYCRVLKNPGDRKNDALFNLTLSRSLSCSQVEVAALSRELIVEGRLDEPIKHSIRGIPEALALVGEIHEKNRYRQVVATNPVMPEAFNVKRMALAGIHPEVFIHITGSERYSCQKKNSLFYRELLENLGVAAETCLMIGNDVKKDLVSRAIGIPFFLIENPFTQRSGAPPGLSPDASGDYRALRKLLLG